MGHLRRCLRHISLNVALLRFVICSLAALHLSPNPVPLAAQVPCLIISWQLLWLDSLFGLYDLLDLYRPGEGCPSPGRFQFYGQASRPISTGKLNTLL